AGGSGSKTLVLLVTAANGSTLHNSVTLSSDSAQASATFPLDTPVSNAGAITHGSAYGVDVNLLGTHLINQLGATGTTAPPSPSVREKDLAVVPIPGVVTISLVRQTSASSITDHAISAATSTVANVNLLSGAITADAVQGVSESGATPQTAGYNSIGS